RHFEEDLRLALHDPAALARQSDEEYDLFGDTIEELSTWYCFRQEDTRRRERREDIDWSNVLWRSRTAVNPYRNVGRDDLCPCGSGRKFKKCCLTANLGLAPFEAA